MNDYYIKAIMLVDCPYSIRAAELLKNNNIPNKSIWITYKDKDKYVNDMIDTYPQIYLKKYNTNQSLLLGGYDDMAEFIMNFKSQKYNINEINIFMKKYKWSKKATLRMIQMLNVK